MADPGPSNRHAEPTTGAKDDQQGWQTVTGRRGRPAADVGGGAPHPSMRQQAPGPRHPIQRTVPVVRLPEAQAADLKQLLEGTCNLDFQFYANAPSTGADWRQLPADQLTTAAVKAMRQVLLDLCGTKYHIPRSLLNVARAAANSVDSARSVDEAQLTASMAAPRFTLDAQRQPVGAVYTLHVQFPAVLRSAVLVHLAMLGGLLPLEAGRAEPIPANVVWPGKVAPTGWLSTAQPCQLVQLTCPTCPRLAARHLMVDWSESLPDTMLLWVGRAAQIGNTAVVRPLYHTSLTDLSGSVFADGSSQTGLPACLHLPAGVRVQPDSLVALMVGGRSVLTSGCVRLDTAAASSADPATTAPAPAAPAPAVQATVQVQRFPNRAGRSAQPADAAPPSRGWETAPRLPAATPRSDPIPAAAVQAAPGAPAAAASPVGPVPAPSAVAATANTVPAATSATVPDRSALAAVPPAAPVPVSDVTRASAAPLPSPAHQADLGTSVTTTAPPSTSPPPSATVNSTTSSPPTTTTSPPTTTTAPPSTSPPPSATVNSTTSSPPTSTTSPSPPSDTTPPPPTSTSSPPPTITSPHPPSSPYPPLPPPPPAGAPACPSLSDPPIPALPSAAMAGPPAPPEEDVSPPLGDDGRPASPRSKKPRHDEATACDEGVPMDEDMAAADEGVDDPMAVSGPASG